MTTHNTIEFTRVNNDVNGNPRYVCHFTNLLTDADRNSEARLKALKYNTDRANDGKLYVTSIDIQYNIAINRAKKLGGRKFHNKQYGGGIVFQSYNIADTERQINELLSSINKRREGISN